MNTIFMTRFHLLTLLLVCVFAGAVVGVVLHRDAWRLEYTLPQKVQPDDNPFTPQLLTINNDGTKLGVLSFHSMSLFDLQYKKKLWTKSFQSDATEIRFMTNEKTIEILFDESRASMQFSATDGAMLTDEDTSRLDYQGKSSHWQKNYRFISFAPTRDEQIHIYNLSNLSPHAAVAVESGYEFTFSDINYPVCTGYFKDGNRIAIGGRNYLGIWRRMRNYGWIGFLELPLTWVALLSFACLNVIFFRWVRGRIRNREVRNG